jgi:hypothetical protein
MYSTDSSEIRGDMPRDRSLVASTAEIRADFPALERMQDGKPVAYFDLRDLETMRNG